MRYPQCGEDAWHPILEGEQITSFQIGYSNEPCLLGVSFWAQKDCPLVKSVLREYFTEENFKNDSIFWDDCITSVLRQIPIRVREVSSSDACEMNTGIEYKCAQNIFKIVYPLFWIMAENKLFVLIGLILWRI